MDVAVKVLFQFCETGKQRAVSVACLGRRCESVREFAHARQRLTRIIVLLQHAGHRPVQRHHGGISGAEGPDRRKQNLLFLRHVAIEFFGHRTEDVKHLDQRRSVAAVNLRDTFRHRMNPGKFRTQVSVVSVDDVLDQFDWRQQRRVVFRFGWSGIRGLKLLDYRLQTDAFQGAGFAQRAAALTAEIDPEYLENPGLRGVFGNDFADGAVRQRSAGGSEYGSGVTHGVHSLARSLEAIQEKSFLNRASVWITPFGASCAGRSISDRHAGACLISSANSMISFPDALDQLLAAVQVQPTEEVRIENAGGRVLRQDIRADRAFPPFDRVMMDGYALRAVELDVIKKFHITGSAPAGKPRVVLSAETGSCVEVMTGAPVPEGADCIVPVERTAQEGDGFITVADDFEAQPGRFIHPAGSDASENSILLQAGIRLGSREIGIAASCGAAMLSVSRQPRITLIPTGDEIVTVDASPEAHQIRQSNGHAMRCALQAAGYPSVLADTLADDAEANELRVHLESGDWLVLTGAISKGARDFIPAMLERLGCRKLFHGVVQRPGKPAGCWQGPAGQMIVALPGNPVSALTGLHAFVLPALAIATGLPLPKPRLVIPVTPFNALPDMTLHLPVSLDDAGRAKAAPTGNSGDFIGLLKSDGFVTLPPRGAIQAAYPYTPWR
jgi:molybdopterin molybdotransferase